MTTIIHSTVASNTHCRKDYIAPVTDVVSCDTCHVFAASGNNYGGNGDGWVDDDDEELDFGGAKGHDWSLDDDGDDDGMQFTNPYKLD